MLCFLTACPASLQNVPSHNPALALHLGQAECSAQSAALAGLANFLRHEWHCAQVYRPGLPGHVHEVGYRQKECVPLSTVVATAIMVKHLQLLLWVCATCMTQSVHVCCLPAIHQVSVKQVAEPCATYVSEYLV